MRLYGGSHWVVMLAWMIGLTLGAILLSEACDSFRRARRRYARRLDPDSGMLGGRCRIRLPRPDRYPVNGLNHVVKYIARMMKSRADHTSLIISSPDRKKACLILGNCGQLTLVEQVLLEPTARKPHRPFERSYVPPGSPEPEKEAAIRRLFEELGIDPEMDEVHDFNGHANHMRHLQYPLGNEVTRATTIVKRYLQEVYEVEVGDGLNFTIKL